ncbi:MAG: excinuclease ABC subunit A, partial [Planctomycetes bacterium]|nr:excinuclease ABC subunit A [Planctomycetota bacterium]
TARGSRDFIRGLRCSACDVALPTPTPGLFSFNTPYGACEECRGFGRIIEIDWGRVVPDRRLSIRSGAIKPWTSKGRRAGRWRTKCRKACEDRGIDIDVPWEKLPEDERDFVIAGAGREWPGVSGFFRSLDRKKYRMHIRVLLSRYRGFTECPSCRGGRLRPEAFCFRVGGMTLPEFWKLPVRDGVDILAGLESGGLRRPERLVVEEISSRLGYLKSVGLGYLALDRQSRTLSGGEVERVNLTAALGASLVDTLFVLDEPSIGLHARDNARLLEILRQVRDRGNTVVVVEHDPEIIAAADHVIDMGPGSGSAGGEVVAAGNLAAIIASEASLTGSYLRGERQVAGSARDRRKTSASRCLRIKGARENNLRGLNVDIPVDVFTAVSGVSGSGKSSLLHQVLWRHWQREQGLAIDGDVLVDSIEGLELVDEIVLVDQSPIGKTPRGNPATYTKVFDRIRKLFAATDEAREAGFDAGCFSFNVEGGRCEECKGAGMIQVEMQFLSDVTLSCESCDGRRFRREVLGIRYRERNIHEVLQLTIDDAAL